MKLPALPRFEDLDGRIQAIVTRNPLAFPAPIATRLSGALHFVEDSADKVVEEHGGQTVARQLLLWQPPEIEIGFDHDVGGSGSSGRAREVGSRVSGRRPAAKMSGQGRAGGRDEDAADKPVHPDEEAAGRRHRQNALIGPHGRISVFVGSFEEDDDREAANELDAPTVLAWRLLEDLCAAALDIEEHLLDADVQDATGVSEEAVWDALGDERDAIGRLGELTDELIEANPQFFPPFLTEQLDQGAFVTDAVPPEFEGTIGFWERGEAGSRIVVIGPELAAFVGDGGQALLIRELLLTLCHEFEHHHGEVRGHDPLADREEFHDKRQ